MPGIAGIITKNTDTSAVAVELSTMLDSMCHEPFYTHGGLNVPDLGCHIAWVAHRESYSDCNPILNSTGDVALIFSGEHFSTPATAARTQREGRTASELLGLYDKKGDGFVADLNGWFAGLLIDRRRRNVTLFNDRYGVHRIYYTQTKDAFVFASEAKAVLAVCPDTRRLDDVGLGQFLVFATTLEDRTLFSDVRLLPPAAAWTFTGTPEPKKRCYFTPDAWEHQRTSSAEGFYEDLKATVFRVLPQYYRARTGAAVSLTGGLDTRIIMAARPEMDEATPCYTYGGFYRDCYDVHAARDVAATSGQPHHIIPLKRDFFDDFATYAERTVFLTDGYLDITGSHELYFQPACSSAVADSDHGQLWKRSPAKRHDIQRRTSIG